MSDNMYIANIMGSCMEPILFNEDKFSFMREDFDLEVDNIYHIETSTGNAVKFLKAFPGDVLEIKFKEVNIYNCYINNELQSNSLGEEYLFFERDYKIIRGHEGVLRHYLFMSNTQNPEWHIIPKEQIKGLLWQRAELRKMK